MRSNDSLKLIVVGIAKTLDDAGLSELFSTFGTVAEAKVVLDANTKQSRGFGFVTFTAGSAMRAAIKEMNQKKVGDRVLNVRHLVPKDEFKKTDANDADAASRPCWLLRKGKCTKGAACPFSHETKNGEFGSCFEFAQTGTCKRGDKCIFHHPTPAGEDGEVADDGGDKAPTVKTESEVVKPDQKKIKSEEKTGPRVCYSFQNGRCHRGKKCLFVHEKLPETAVPQPPAPAKASKIKTVATSQRNEFELVTQQNGEAGKKRRREEVSDDDDDEDMEPQKPTGKGKANAPTSPPLKGLAAHVNDFMGSQKLHLPKVQQPKRPQQPRVAFEWKPKALESKPKQEQKKAVAPAKKPQPEQTPTPAQLKEEAPAKVIKQELRKPELQEETYHAPPPAKKIKREKIDMGAAFDGLSDDEGDNRRRGPSKKVVDKEQLKATRAKMREERKAKRSTKKSALSRLQIHTDEPIEL